MKRRIAAGALAAALACGALFGATGCGSQSQASGADAGASGSASTEVASDASSDTAAGASGDAAEASGEGVESSSTASSESEQSAGNATGEAAGGPAGMGGSEASVETTAAAEAETNDAAAIEKALDLANMGASWTYSEEASAWTLSPVAAVTNPEILDQQGVSVCVPAAYVKGVDTNGDGDADATDGTATGVLVIDYDAQVTSSNGQVYTAATAPVILNTGAAGYSSSTNTTAATTYASEGYVNVSCGNRGKQDTVTDADGNEVFTGDAPSCLVDQKNAARFVKYNILLGNLPGSVDYFVSTGGSGGGAHASMFAATSNNPDFYDYEIEAGAVGVYKNDDGTYDTTVSVDGKDVALSDGAWGCVAYSAITSLAEADMAMAFEYYLDPAYDFGSDFQAETAKLLAAEYMDYINGQKLSVSEEAVGLDVDGDGKVSGTVALSIEYDADKYADTNGYGGTYLDLYLAEFQQNLQWYLDNLDYAEDWTWFDSDGNALPDEDVTAMTTADKALAFIEGRYAKGSSGDMRGPGGGMGRMGDGIGRMGGTLPDGGRGPGGPNGEGQGGTLPDEGSDSAGDSTDSSESASSNASAEADTVSVEAAGSAASVDSAEEGASGEAASSASAEAPGSSDAVSAESSDSSESERSFDNAGVADNSTGDTMDVGTPDAGTTQASGSGTDSANYASFDEMLAAYEADIAEVEAGDEYGNNIVELYNPRNYIGATDTDAPTWARIVCGASEGDISMLNSLNMEIDWLNAGTDATIEWQWDGGHVPSETLGNSLALWVDTMYGEHVDGAVKIEKPAAEAQTANGTATEASGTDISGWVKADDLQNVSFSLADAAAYRTAGASKAIPGFDTIDYGQEDYVFGSATADARHWDKYVLAVFKENADTLSSLLNAG